ncbi:MAG: KUP/HAK/KT family potassium transporter, partial [Desulfobacterales bacterium]|nr:KUP/HAK/KT family potassium transporter [Desulfobacterales bacterium]
MWRFFARALHARPILGPKGSKSATVVGQNGFWLLSLTALGVVYGDIGTSPLYAVRECFSGPHAVDMNAVNIFGVASLIFWSLAGVISVKYIGFILRADHHGEGGIFALRGLILGGRHQPPPRTRKAIVLGAIFGAALLYGDGVITPSISVLSAVE